VLEKIFPKLLSSKKCEGIVLEGNFKKVFRGNRCIWFSRISFENRYKILGGKMRFMRLGIIALLVFQFCPAFAKIVRVIDVDGTITRDRGQNAAWRTDWILKRIDSMHTMMQPNPLRPKELQAQIISSPELIGVSYNEFRAMERLLGKGEGQLGDLRPFKLEPDPLMPNRPAYLVPGFYRISPDITFQNYRPGSDGVNPLLRDYKLAVERSRIMTDKKWQGPGFPIFQAGMSDPKNLVDVVLFTARYHTDQEFAEWIDAMRDDGFINASSSVDENGRTQRPRFLSLNEPESLLFGKSVSDRKQNVPAAVASQLLHAPGVKHLELVTDEYGARKGYTQLMHTIIVAEDDSRHIERIRKVMENLSSDMWYRTRIKFVLFNAGSDEEVRNAAIPNRWTVFDRGFNRAALPREIKLWTTPAGCETKLNSTLPKD
jgi:hypothetical protein